MAEKSKKPAIRFAGFTDAWEQRKLGELADIVGGGTPSTGVSEYWDGDIDWYAPAEITDQIFINSSQRKITAEGFAHSSARMLPEGTVLFTSRAGIGKTAILQRKGCTNQGFQSIIPHKDVLISYFIFSRTEELKEYGETIGAGSTFVEVSGKQMAEMELMMPPTIDEQRQIGTYFHNLDNLITLHQRKYDKLVNVKKAMLEKMFPKDGADVPEIRFKGFTEAWEQRKFNELYEKVSEKNDLTYGKEDIISVANMYYKTDSYITNPEYLKTYNVFHFGDIAFEGNKNKNFAHGRFVENTIGNGIISHVFDVFRPKMKYEYLFWKYAINNERIMGRILLKCTKSSTMMTNLVAADFLKEQIFVPSLNEQKSIGNYIYKIDNLITLHQRKLEKLKNLKKACLEKMFV